MKRIFFSIVFLFSSLFALADNFLVTTNADTGTGSLREAITLANANGTSVRDFIHFQIPAANTTEVTIALSSALPLLTSNIELDATTQSTTYLSSLWNIRVRLTNASGLFFNGFELFGVEDVAIYGFDFQQFRSADATPDNQRAGIFIRNVKRITLGAPGKNNSFGLNYAGILAPTLAVPEPVEQVRISANIVGLSPSGTPAPNSTGIDLSFLKNSIVGGANMADGNIVSGNTESNIDLASADGDLLVSYNWVGVGSDGNLKTTISGRGIKVSGQTVNVSILNNVVGNQKVGIYLEFVRSHNILIAGNIIGRGVTLDANRANEYGIHLNGCFTGSIRNDNVLAYNLTAVRIENSHPISILKNSFYCNTNVVVYEKLPGGKVLTPTRISTITPIGASGTYLPNSTVELFYSFYCAGSCQGRTWLATVTADATGNWSYNGPIVGPITSMGTDEDGATLSGFSQPILNTSAVEITGVFCGLNNGSIRKLITYDASRFEWFDSNNVLVGTSLDLINVGAGTYTLKTGQGSDCDVPIATFIIGSSPNGINDANVQITPVYCGNTLGSIRNIGITNDPPRIWYNATGDVQVGTGNDLIDVPAGTYYFKAGSAPCEIRSKNYTIDNVVVTYTAGSTNIVGSTCGNNNGSISIAGWVGATPASLSWRDGSGTVFSSAANIANLAPGSYTLSASNGNGCTLDVATYTVPAIVSPVIDLSNVDARANCSGSQLIMTGAVVTGTTAPYAYTWLDENDVVVYSDLQLMNVKPGRYYLQVKDKNGCIVSSSLQDYSAATTSALDIPTAFTPNGDGVNDTWKIKGSNIYPDADFRVFNRLGGLVFSSPGYREEFTGKGLPAGVYYYVIDLKNTCPVRSGSVTIIH